MVLAEKKTFRQEKVTLAAELEQAVMLVQRLERLSADSAWAHAASGMRGAILRCVNHLESGGESTEAAERARLQALILSGFDLLERAARELAIPEPQETPQADGGTSSRKPLENKLNG